MPSNLPAHFRLEFHGTVAGTSAWATTVATTAIGMDPANINIAAYAALIDTHFQARWSPTLAGLNFTDTLYTGCTARYYPALSSAALLQASHSPGAALPGSSTPSGPASQALVVTLQTATPGRTGRGRMYLPATAALGTAGDAHKFVAATLTTLGTKLQAFYQALATDSPDGLNKAFAAVTEAKHCIDEVLSVDNQRT